MDKNTDEIKVGEKLSKLRKEKGYSIAALSKLSDVSTGLISQIERDLVVPSVVSLWKLAKALDTSINYFFDEKKDIQHTIIRSGEHRIIITEKGFAEYEMLSPSDSDPSRILDFTKITLKSGEEIDKDDLVSHEGEECGYVLEGSMIVRIRDRNFTLNKGDSIYFKSSQPHKYYNISDADCVSIWAMTPVFF
jgi:transcriptional regulator with XRE-family HTH domain